MGFDVSYHPIDTAFLEEYVFPFVLGDTHDETPLEEAALAVGKRFKANTWGLGALNLHHESTARLLRETQGGFLRRLALRFKPRPPKREVDFDSDLYVWGRPFFVSLDEAPEVSASIDRYLNSPLDEVDRIAREMLCHRWPDFVEEIQPDLRNGPPSEAELSEEARWKIDLFRDAHEAIRKGTMVKPPQSTEVDPRDLFRSDFQLAVLEFASICRPGWMARGYLWPTKLVEQAGLAFDYFESSDVPFEPIKRHLPGVQLRSDASITENFMLGGYLCAERVPQFRQFLAENLDRLVAPAIQQGWEYDCRLALRKINEALVDAEIRGIGFIEAAEIYSAPFGKLN